MSYSTGIKTRYIDPVSHYNNRTTFKLPDNEQYHLNFKLAHVGVLTQANTNYNACGIYGLIKSITLYSGKEQLDRLDDVARYMNFKNRLNTNESNKDINKYNNRTALGFEIDAAQQIAHLRAANGVVTVETPHDLGLIQLSDLLPVLRDLTIYDTSMFKNTSLVIEWNTDTLNFLQSSAAVVNKIVQPILICDQITNPKVAQNLSKFQGNVVVTKSIVHDSINIEAINVSGIAGTNQVVTQPIQQKLGGFRNRVVQNLVMIKAFSNPAVHIDNGVVVGSGILRSPVQINEHINLRVNGQPLFSESIVYDSCKAQLVQEIFGDINQEPYENSLSIGLDNTRHSNPIENNYIGIPNDRNVVGMNSLFAVKLNMKINTLELDYSRDGIDDTNATKLYSQPLTLHFYGDVGKVIQFQNGTFSIQFLGTKK